MPVRIDEQTYYYTGEVLKEVGITRTTFYRWLKEGKIEDVTLRDRNRKRLFTEEDVEKLKKITQVTINTKE